jgi:hypothetical protein
VTFLHPDYDDHFSWAKDEIYVALPLLRVCKKFNRIALPMFFHCLELSMSSQTCSLELFSLLNQRPWLAKNCKCLHFSDRDMEESEQIKAPIFETAFSTLFTHIKKLELFHCWESDAEDIQSLLTATIGQFETVEELAINSLKFLTCLASSPSGSFTFPRLQKLGIFGASRHSIFTCPPVRLHNSFSGVNLPYCRRFRANTKNRKL